MVKSVIGEESQLKTLENRLLQSSLFSQVGIIIGKLNPNSDRGFIYDLIPTPLTDSGSPACELRPEPLRKGAKGGKLSNHLPPPLEVDEDWVAEHARQVSRMLMRGMDVVGVYLWAAEASFKVTSPSTILQIVRGVAQAAHLYDSETD